MSTISKSASEAASCSAIERLIRTEIELSGLHSNPDLAAQVIRGANEATVELYKLRDELSALHTERQKDAELIASLTKQVEELKKRIEYKDECFLEIIDKANQLGSELAQLKSK